MTKVLLDMNQDEFHKQLFALKKIKQRALLNTLIKIKNLSWEELYKNKDIRWELITSIRTLKGNNIYSFRFSQKYRGCIQRW